MRKFSLTFLFFLICLAMKAQNIEVNTLLFQESRLTARSNNDELILRSMTEYEGNTDSMALQSVLFYLDASTDVNCVKGVKVYTTGLSSSQNNKYLDKAVLIGSCTPQEGDFLCETNGYLYKGINYLWFAVDVDDDAEEGNSIDMSVLSLTVNDEAYDVKNPNPTGSREIILARTTLLRPGDYNSTNYRIPAVITARDGSIVAVTDKRKYNNGDNYEDYKKIKTIKEQVWRKFWAKAWHSAQ